MSKPRGHDRSSRVISIVSIVIAVLSAYFSYQANLIAREANEIAFKEARAIIVVDQWPPLLSSVTICRDRLSGQYRVSCSVLLKDAIFSNRGGQGTSLVQVHIREQGLEFEPTFMGTNFWSPGVNVYEDDKKLVLPCDIPAGASRRWSFEREEMHWFAQDRCIDALSKYQSLVSGSHEVWEFRFGNGQELTYPVIGISVSRRISGPEDIEECR